ncbi:MAG TPA: pyridoxamine 5'-phosphate oxidase [Prolixibacteraceae bacterium]|nr:pyridoxamine 5'-phosphate oxidase [Prolixibacteraceae bacterium]
MERMHLDAIREEYGRGILRRRDLTEVPGALFVRWLEEAIAAGVAEPTAMVVSTIGERGFPESRVVLLKSFDGEGFVFYTGYRSQKGKALSAEPRAALLFFWPELQRQVRITGVAEKVSREASEAYFRSRPVSSQLGALASEQSAVIPSRAWLENRYRDLERQYAASDIPVPLHWGGFRVLPAEMEFWQGRENRLHDRFRYTRHGLGWKTDRLSP